MSFSYQLTMPLYSSNRSLFCQALLTLKHLASFHLCIIMLDLYLCFSLCVVDTVSFLVCQVHHLPYELFRAESYSSRHVLAAAHTIFLDSREQSSIIVKYQYPFILLSMNTAWGFSLPSSSKESKLRTTEKVGFVLAQWGCMVRNGLKKNIRHHHQTKTNHLVFATEQESWDCTGEEWEIFVVVILKWK